MISNIFLTIVATLTLSSFAYGEVDTNLGAPYAIYFDNEAGVVTYDLVKEPEFWISIVKTNFETKNWDREQLIKINCSKDTFVYEIKEMIEDVLDIPFDKIILVFGGRVLEDQYSLNYYNTVPYGFSLPTKCAIELVVKRS